jgi:hypothetical protein
VHGTLRLAVTVAVVLVLAWSGASSAGTHALNAVEARASLDQLADARVISDGAIA